MSRRIIYIITGLLVSIFFAWMFLGSNQNKDEFTEIVKLSLRDVGNQLLLKNQDTTSLVLPIIELEPNARYQLTFQKPLAITPDSLSAIVKSSFQLTNLPQNYRVSVMQCSNKETAYSFEMKNLLGNDIVPCSGRLLPKDCYAITVRFTEKTTYFPYDKIGYGLLFIIGLLPVIMSLTKKKLVATIPQESSGNYTSIGSFRFYPEQNKLVKQADEINLSKKECELLILFIEKANQVIKREELTKKVWEDHGVVVGRSLDTYISKLRKKLQADTSIKLTNVHGVGYKLEVN